MKQRLAVIDYGTGNAFSLRKVLERLGVHAEYTSDTEVIRRSDKIVLPGVGHFGKAMRNLRMTGVAELLNEQVMINRKPVLGICLGMQLFATSSEESEVAGLNWIQGHVIRLKSMGPRYKIPHVGWNVPTPLRKGVLLEGTAEGSEFYFVHAYHFAPRSETTAAAETRYGANFVSVVEHENIFGVQFHPEKSFENGFILLRNFLSV